MYVKGQASKFLFTAHKSITYVMIDGINRVTYTGAYKYSIYSILILVMSTF